MPLQRSRRAAAAAIALGILALAPTPSSADCDPASVLANVRAKITFLHTTFSGTSALTAPLNLADDAIARTDDLLSQGAPIRKTKRQIRGIVRKLRAFRRHVRALRRRGVLDLVTTDTAVGQVDATIVVLLALEQSVPACPTTTTVTVTTSSTSTSSTSTTNTTTHSTHPTLTFVTTTSTSTTKTTTHSTRPTFTFITIPTTIPKLDYMGAANYGEANLSAGFAPDPYSVGMTTGGNVNVSYLGGSCSGFASTRPDLRINFGGGGASLLRIYFVGSTGDATMVVNDPYGNFYCVDDSFGTVNPTIDFNNPAGGSYAVWIGSYASNTNISGTLYLTENSGHHP